MVDKNVNETQENLCSYRPRIERVKYVTAYKSLTL
jgi:hypothetical protein